MKKNTRSVVWTICMTVPLLVFLGGCYEPKPVSPDAEKELVVRYKADGTKEITDGNGAPLEKFELENPKDVVGSLAKRLKKDGLRVTKTNDPLVVTFEESPKCTCECDGGYCQCSPRGCAH